MTVGVIDIQGARKILNIHFCRTCGVDTMPSDLTGQCFWCDTKIAAPSKKAVPAERRPDHCHYCDAVIPAGRGTRNPRTKYCSDRCRRHAWFNSPKGFDYRDRKSRARRPGRIGPDGLILCRVCDVRKPIDAFARDRTQPLGVMSRCKECDNEKSKAYYRAHKAQQRRAA